MEEAQASPDKVGAKRGLWRWAVIAAVFAALVITGLYWRKHSINGSVQEALAGEINAETSVYRRGWFGGNDIVFNVESTTGEISMIDMTRRLLKSAEALKDQEFGKVYLANKGTEKFYLEGSYFKQIGQEREWQNPVYTIRTMPEHVFRLDGTPAFGTWSGGLIGVVGEQFEDNAELHKEWWANDAIADLN